ncbi:hypothetical protein BJV78DRAFT_1129951 [Lactifluus subvellereus]|nr:hypothetical protein BJV78DRAFT_1129951 [Lactifluus subvellereus]
MIALATSCTRTYAVQEGDFCDKISAAHNVSTYQLAVVNPSINSDCTNLLPGQILCLGLSEGDCTTTYVVKPDDDCDIVSFAHQINSTVFRSNNPQLNANCSNMYIGEVLCTAQTVTVSHPPPGGKVPATAIPTTAAPSKHTDGPVSEDDLPWCD